MDINEKQRKRPTKIEDMTKEQIREAVVKKRECNAKAQNIVESLLERNIKEDFFLKCLQNINQTHFEDVVEERAILQICGYPLCRNALSTKDIPKQTYRISLKTNKVYDITARKSFCSNSCYKSAMHVKKQMLTSPLWFRDYEEIPKFHLLPSDTVGSLGIEIDVSLVENIKQNEQFSSVSDCATDSLKEIDDNYRNAVKTFEHCMNEYSPKNVEEKSNIDETVLESEVSKADPEKMLFRDTPKNKNKSTNNLMNIVGDIIEKPERKIDPILQNTPNFPNRSNVKENSIPIQKNQPVVTLLSIEVEKCLAEWFTIDTMLLLCGEEKVKEMLTDKGECIKKYLNNYSTSIFYNSNNYDQYQALCRKLNMLEMDEKRSDTQILQKETKPLPDYSILQEESKKMQLKVKAFFAGDTEEQNIKDSDEKPAVSQIEEDIPLTNLPLVDKNAQNALRRRIVCQHLNKVLPDILKSLGLLSLSISSDVRLLVNTFKLKANNIMFKPNQWILIAIIVIKLLSLRDKRLEYLLQQPIAYQHLQLLLLSYKQDGGYLERLISWLTDIDRLLDTNDKQLTVE